ncbi:MAG: Gfo/Idh/MocA family oxidoreductase [Chloroflexi bacterium]|nr:Gfo/Idh/MocA family oxidoreductase [Chloroflexota bacterium]
MSVTGQPVGIGLVGAGAYGDFCLAAFADVPEVRIAAICDTDAVRARHFAGLYGTPAYTKLEALLEDPAVEIVALNTPPFLHAAQGIDSLRAGKHLFCEKPLAMRIEEGEAMRAAAERAGVRLTVDYVMRSNPLWRAAAEIRASGVLGGLLHMDLANHAAGLSLPASHWFWDKAKSGGIWVEHGVHFFDAFAWVAGADGTITAAQAFVNGAGQEDRVEALARYGSAAAHFYHGFTHDGMSEQTTIRLAFERGDVTLWEWVPTLMEVDSVRPGLIDTVRSFLPGSVRVEEAPGGLMRLNARLTEGKSAVYRRCIQEGIRDLAGAVRNPGVPLRVTAEHGLASLRMAADAERLGRPR